MVLLGIHWSFLLCESTNEGPSTISGLFLLDDCSPSCLVVGLCFGVSEGPDNGEGLVQLRKLKMKAGLSSVPTAVMSLRVCETYACFSSQSSPFCDEGGGLSLLVNYHEPQELDGLRR